MALSRDPVRELAIRPDSSAYADVRMTKVISGHAAAGMRICKDRCVSYDLHVYAAAVLSTADLRDLVARIPRLEVADFDAARRWYSVERGARRRYCFTVDGPFDVEAEDVPEEVTTTLFGVTHVFYVTVEGSADADVPYAVRFARTLAQALGGVVVDQQSDQIWARGLERTSATSARNERVKVINLAWYTRRMFVGPNVGARYPAICRRLLPEAPPRRFGEYEPFQGKLAEAGDDGFANAWRDATSSLFFTASPPCISGSMSAGPAEQHPCPIWHMSVNLHYQPLAADARWREAVRRFFLAIAEDLHAFFASAEVTRGNIWNGRSIWSDGETEWPIMPARVQGWMGLLPYPLWWAWYGEPYRGLILLGHLSGGEVTETTSGTLHQLAAEPIDRDALTGRTTRRAGLRSVTSWTRSDLLAHVRANDGRVRPTPIDPADCIPADLQ
jgi:hypothetical protein